MRILICLTAFLIFQNIAHGEDTICWNPKLKLSWQDFKGQMQSTSGHAALTSAAITYKLTYGNSGFSCEISCCFYPKESWTSSLDQYILIHEQGHFDISEIFARRLRKAFKEYTYNQNSVKTDLQKIYDTVIIARDLMNRLYDEETKNSTNSYQQQSWNNKIKSELLKLNNFSSTLVKQDFGQDKLDCYADKLKRLMQADPLYSLIRTQFRDTFRIMKNDTLFFKISERNGIRIDDAVFFDKSREHCLLVVLVKTNPNSFFGKARVISATKHNQKWIFKPNVEYVFSTSYFQSYSQSNFADLASLARYNILAAGEPEKEGCNLDEKYWFK